MDSDTWKDYVGRVVQRADDAASDVRVLIAKVESLSRQLEEAGAELRRLTRDEDLHYRTAQRLKEAIGEHRRALHELGDAVGATKASAYDIKLWEQLGGRYCPPQASSEV